MNPTKKLPLFIITGASGVGKSTMCELLFRDMWIHKNIGNKQTGQTNNDESEYTK